MTENFSLINRPTIDIVIPTMWRPAGVAEAIATYASCKEVSTIIVIDNDPVRGQPFPPEALNKIKVITTGENIYVNPAWNKGASLCQSRLICLANDDIFIQPELFAFIQALEWDNLGIDLIGLDASRTPTTSELKRISVNLSQPLGAQYPTFGACMFMQREAYKQIPSNLSVWFGDDFLVHSNEGIFLLATPLVRCVMSTTIKSFDASSQVHKLIRSDMRWANKNLLRKNLEDSPAASEKDEKISSNSSMASTISVDLGCGETPRNPFKAARVIGLDPNCSGSNITECWVGFEPIPLDESSIDFVTAFDFIEHIPRFALKDKPFNPFIDTMSEVWRILKPGGKFYARTPAYPSAAAFQDPTHVNIITDQTVSYFAKRPCLDGSFVDPWGLPLGKRYGFTGEFVLIKQWWETTHLCWLLEAAKP